MNSKSIGEIATISTGFTFRKTTKINGQPIPLLQAKDIKKGITLDIDNLEVISLDYKSPNAILRANDVVISSRGSFRAAVIHTRKPVLAASSIFILRLMTDSIIPEYLALYLNSNQGQSQLINFSTSGSIPSLLKPHLRDLKISMPSLQKQNNLVKLFQNIEEQKRLLQTKETLINKIAESALSHQLN